MLERLTVWLGELFSFCIRHHEDQLPGKCFRLMDFPGFCQLCKMLRYGLQLSLLQFCIWYPTQSLEYMVKLLSVCFPGALQLTDQLMYILHRLNL